MTESEENTSTKIKNESNLLSDLEGITSYIKGNGISTPTKITDETKTSSALKTNSSSKKANSTSESSKSIEDKEKNTNTSITTKPTESENTSKTTNPTEDKNHIPSSMELKKIGSLQYYLYTPSNPENDMPLIIYLHGGTNKKEDAPALLTTDGFPKYLYDGYYGDLRAYVAIPKLDNQYKGWADIYEQIRNLITSIHTNYGIDMNKISLTGHSMGGTGTYQLQVKLPNTFVCIAPASGSIQNNEANLKALGKTKIWAFVGTNDTIVSPDSSRIIIKTLNERGASAKITELSGATHFDVPSLAYKNNTLIQWLINCGK